MRAKHLRRAAGRAFSKRPSAFVITLALLCALLPSPVYASSAGSGEYLCGHVHDETVCGFSEGNAGVPCDHAHDESCYTRELQCPHICEHVCSHVCGAECCADGELCAHVCDAECGGLCGHEHDGSCYSQALDCEHEHGGDCAYVPPTTGTPCSHVCRVTAFYTQSGGQVWTAGAPVGTFEAAQGASCESICAALPGTVRGALECAAGAVDIPVRWSCDTYSADAEVNVFSAELVNAYCDYNKTDDPLTPDTDESAMPYIEVTAAAAPTATPVCLCIPEPGADEAHTDPECPFYALPQLTKTVPLLTERALAPVTADDGSTIGISGLLPENAFISVKLIPVEAAMELVGAESDAAILFAYDIKIMLPAETEGGAPAEYQPEHPVTVSITPPEDKPIEAPVEVTHIAEDAESGATTTQPVENVTTTRDGAVQFPAEGFSVYIITLSNTREVTFDVASSAYTVKYGTTDATPANITAELATAAVTTNGPLYFTVTADTPPSSVTRDGSTIAPDANGVYTVADISADTKIYIGDVITFDLAKGPVVIGAAGYSGYSSGWTNGDPDLSGTHATANKYTVTQTNGQTLPTSNTISFSGAGTYDVTLDGIKIQADTLTNSFASCISITGIDNMAVTLKLKGNNSIDRLHYYGGGSLTITSADGNGSTNGTLTATSANSEGEWAAAIGGTDDNDSPGHIIINGGTISATGKSAAAIGGGGNGSAAITINGGNVTAVNNGNSAAIGGGGAATGDGGNGTVTINGGTVSATNTGAGADLGGGSTNNSIKTGGTATVRIAGGTVVAGGTRGISGGTNSVSYTAADVAVSGGSYKGSVEGGAQFTDNNGATYRLTELTLQNAEGNAVSGAVVSKINDKPIGAGVVTDGAGKIYPWLVDGTSATSAVANGTETYNGSAAAGGSGILRRGAAITNIVFYLNKGNVTISAGVYSGCDASGNSFSVEAGNVTSCTVTQTDPNTPNNNTISFTGNDLTAAVILNGINSDAVNSISIPATNDNIKHITLLLAGTNRVRSLYYYTGGDSTVSANASTLLIDNAYPESPGELIAYGPEQWQAAIGGTDTNSAVTGLTIAGGNITASGAASAAIGGGGNGYSVITITGGTVTATSRGTGAAIGGGGGNNSAGGAGTVSITGGTVTATNSGSGVAIGGGGSSKSSGSAGAVAISGGNVTAASGSGNAIGGGNTQNIDTPSSIGGAATVTVSGGTINTGHIGGGYSTVNGYAASGFTVTGGSINCTTSANPTNESGAPVYMTRVTLYENNTAKANTAVTGLSVQGLGYDYGISGVRTDSEGVLYIGLPQNTSAHTAETSDKTYTGNVPAGSTGILSYGTLAFHTIRVSPSSHYSLWLDVNRTQAFSGVINVTDHAAQHENFDFYLDCTDSGATPTAYIPNASGEMELAGVQPAAVPETPGLYHYSFTEIDGDRVVGFITDVNGTKQLALDLSMGDVVIKSDTPGHEVSCGPYSFGGFVGNFYITTSGINSGNNLTVQSGSPAIFLDKLNLTSLGSGIYFAGGAAAVTYSGYNNQISSSGAAAISVSTGAALNLSTADADNSLTLTSGAASAIGGAGEVNISLTGGHLSLNPHSGSSQITAAGYEYTVTTQASGAPPYSYAPSAGTLAGYQSGSAFFTAENVPAVSARTTFRACSVSYVGMNGTAAADGSDLSITLGGDPPAAVAVMRNGVSVPYAGYSNGELRLSGSEAYGNLIIADRDMTITDMSIETQPAKLTYSHGEALDLDGLSVTLTYLDGTEATVSYSQFAAHGITVSPQDGQILYTETHHKQAIRVSGGGRSASTNALTVKPTVTVVGNPTAGYSVSASTGGQAGSSYLWQISSDNGGTWVPADPAQTGPSFAAGNGMIGKMIRVVVTFGGIYDGDIESSSVQVYSPSFSVTVPLSMAVTVAADGSITVSSGAITNYSSDSVYVKNIAYAWKSEGEGENQVFAGGVFYEHSLVIPTLKLGNDADGHSFTGSDMSWDVDREIAAMSGQTPGTLTLNWSFMLGSGNYIKLAIAAGQEVHVATVTYTVAPTPS